MPRRKKWQPTPVFLPGKSQGQRRLASYSSRGCKIVRYDLATKQQKIILSLSFITKSVLVWMIMFIFTLILVPTSLTLICRIPHASLEDALLQREFVFAFSENQGHYRPGIILNWGSSLKRTLSTSPGLLSWLQGWQCCLHSGDPAFPFGYHLYILYGPQFPAQILSQRWNFSCCCCYLNLERGFLEISLTSFCFSHFITKIFKHIQK